MRDVEAQIAQLEAGIGAGRTQTEGARRIGINPVHQTLLTEKPTKAELERSLADLVRSTGRLDRLWVTERAG